VVGAEDPLENRSLRMRRPPNAGLDERLVLRGFIGRASR
jgi:hypothetical protein